MQERSKLLRITYTKLITISTSTNTIHSIILNYDIGVEMKYVQQNVLI